MSNPLLLQNAQHGQRPVPRAETEAPGGGVKRRTRRGHRPTTRPKAPDARGPRAEEVGMSWCIASWLPWGGTRRRREGRRPKGGPATPVGRREGGDTRSSVALSACRCGRAGRVLCAAGAGSASRWRGRAWCAPTAALWSPATPLGRDTLLQIPRVQRRRPLVSPRAAPGTHSQLRQRMACLAVHRPTSMRPLYYKWPRNANSATRPAAGRLQARRWRGGGAPAGAGRTARAKRDPDGRGW